MRSNFSVGLVLLHYSQILEELSKALRKITTTMSMVMIILGDVGCYHMMFDRMKMILDGIACLILLCV